MELIKGHFLKHFGALECIFYMVFSGDASGHFQEWFYALSGSSLTLLLDYDPKKKKTPVNPNDLLYGL